MTEEHSGYIRDPKALRALAHPLRWQLIELIRNEDTATATRCARALGESVAGCSYHLNLLAKYGFVEHAPGGVGREKRWRLTSREQSWTTEGLSQEGTLAAEAAAEAFLDHEAAQLKDRVRLKALEPEDWRAATGVTGQHAFLTAAETGRLAEELAAVMARYQERTARPELRPPDARPVRLFLAITVAPPTDRVS
ncbi:ArsR/SmtB family transcription factor [Saccharothrix australiensis]|uniref:ArsR family transcriptional regulator n=1 Tax=Saccharothrix australiensis TaxID=2072 RepID=A0A495W351_9PSEU|nr:helix-turn-helix domain-containing protein [Saccharothrix australiensis]RKT54248.1 ArsR family transcriptional regulator [Saccharothrix australiensis]